VCLVEDVVTSGGAAIEAVEALRDAGLRVSNAVCVVDREEGGVDEAAAEAGDVAAELHRQQVDARVEADHELRPLPLHLGGEAVGEGLDGDGHRPER
jgi:orotate phosphoribosyltransferase